MLKFDFSAWVGEVGGDIRKELPYIAPGQDYRPCEFCDSYFNSICHVNLMYKECLYDFSGAMCGFLPVPIA